MRILLVEDDHSIGINLKKILNRETMSVDLAANFKEGFEKGLIEEYDLMILDWMLPDGSGTELCKLFRKEGVVCPVLILTAKSMADDIAEGLDSGADDYLVKPFETKVLLARIRALLRRKENIIPETHTVGEITINLANHTVERRGKPINLSAKEYSLFEYFVKNIERVIDRGELISHVWDENADSFSNTVDVHIRYLRTKLGREGKLIKTERGKGYVLCRN